MQNTLAVINLAAVRANAQKVRALVKDRRFYAVVKADAYGHGAIEVARAIEDVVDGFCVAIAEEGAALRVGATQKPVLVFCPPLDCRDAGIINFYGLTPTVTDRRSAMLVKGGRCQIKINTGMNRYGCNPSELKNVLKLLPKGSVEAAYSHLYAADGEAESLTQLKLFKECENLIKAHSPEAFLHLAASGGILRGGEFLLDGVRAGILLYGYNPTGFSSDVQPAMKVYAPLSQKTRFLGGGVGYAAADRQYRELFTYRAGYADGLKRGVPLGEGSLCMDAFISRDGAQFMPVMTDAEKYAERCGTIPYEVLCSVTKRSHRVYER